MRLAALPLRLVPSLSLLALLIGCGSGSGDAAAPGPAAAGGGGAGGEAGAGAAGAGATGAGATGAGAASSGGAGGGGAGAGAGGPSGGGAGAPLANTFCGLPLPDAPLVVPPGFCARAFAAPGTVTEPRVIRFAPNGDVFVVSPGSYVAGGANGGAGAILVLPDDNHDGVADAALPFAGSASMGKLDCTSREKDPADLTCVHGLAFADGYIYYTRSNEVRRFAHKPGDRKAQQPAGELVAGLGGTQNFPGRFTHTLDVAPDGSLVVSRGRQDSGSCSADDMSLGAVLSVPVQGGAAMPVTPTTLAQGFRNPMYLRCFSGQCFANELSGDNWEGIGGREKVAMLAPGQNWGFPCCVDKGLPTNGATADMCAGVTGSTVAIALHDTPFGLDLERGVWPSPFAHGVFVALHGAFPTWTGTRVVYLGTDANGYPTGLSTDFITGWGSESGAKVNGRATDLAFAPDGRLFVIDDTSGGIWWIAPVGLPLP